MSFHSSRNFRLPFSQHHTLLTKWKSFFLVLSITSVLSLFIVMKSLPSGPTLETELVEPSYLEDGENESLPSLLATSLDLLEPDPKTPTYGSHPQPTSGTDHSINSTATSVTSETTASLHSNTGNKTNLMEPEPSSPHQLEGVISSTPITTDAVPEAKPTDSPPSWTEMWQYEHDLPQHNLSLPFPEGKTGRYVKFKNGCQGLGWNNIYHDILLNAYIAYESGRSYGFPDFWWDSHHYPWKSADWPHTPLTALLSGPISGGSWPSGDDSPRFISERWFETVCPPAETRQIFTEEVKAHSRNLTGIEQLKAWTAILRSAPESCIEIMPSNSTIDPFPQAIDMWTVISPRILTLWDGFVRSPLSTHLRTSPIVMSGVERNEYLFRSWDRTSSSGLYDSVIAVHVRRGDYSSHCHRLWDLDAPFYGWAQHIELPDKLDLPPRNNAVDEDSSPRKIQFMQRCFSDTDEVVKKIVHSRDQYVSSRGAKTRPDTVYLMTNDMGDWLDDARQQLRSHGIHRIVLNSDLRLYPEQKEVSIEVDMEIATRAAVFIGNGWSSVSSTLVHRRYLRGQPMRTTRFF